MKKIICTLALMTLSVTSFANHWQCNEKITGKTQKLDNGFTYCNGSGDWACYFRITETCENTSNGETKVTESTKFRFCTKKLSDCF